MKKILSYITVMAVAAMLAAPIAAYAQEEEKPDVVMNKTVSGPDANGVYNLQLETYVTGKMIHTEEEVRIPADFILLLDTSSSMKGDYPYKSWQEVTRSFSYDRCCDSDRTYYYKWSDGKTYQIKGIANQHGLFYDYRTWLYFEVGTTRYYLKDDKVLQAKDRTNPTFDGEEGTYPYDISGNRIDCTRTKAGTVWTGTLSQYVEYDSRMDAMRIASSRFIDVVYADAVANNVEHRICVIQFNDADYPGTDDKYINPKNSNFLYEENDSGYTSVVKHFLTVNNETNVSSLKKEINNLSAYGDTSSDLGLELSNLEFDYKSFNDNTLRSRAVVMFTDGVPNHGGNPLDPDVANDAIKFSKPLKDKNIKVYTIGIVKNPTTDMVNYMQGVSSNYPSAESMDKLGEGGDNGFYIDASSQALEDVFETIAKEVTEGGASVEVTAEASIVDIVTTDFVLPAGFQKKDILIKVSNYDPSTDSFSTELTNPTEDVKLSDPTVQTDGTTRISVSGYPFSDHWCGEGCGSSGQKLVIIVPIVPSSGCIGGLDIPTNGEDSGLYLPGETEPIATFTPPTVTLPINIIIKKEGLAPGESAIFEIVSSDPAATNPVATLILTGGKAGDPAPTAQVTGLDPHFVYTVKESDWSWTYNSNTGSMSTKDVTANPFTFKNEKKDVDVKNAEAAILNKFEKITK